MLLSLWAQIQPRCAVTNGCILRLPDTAVRYLYATPMTAARPQNLGPKAAAENRRALIAAALEVFGESGVDAPLNQVAKRAGVGQGSLYRHFPTRVDLALAVYEQNADAIEEFAAVDGVTLDDLLGFITQLTIESVAFIEIATNATSDPRILAVSERVFAVLDTAVKSARRAKRIRRGATTAEVMLAVSMLASLLAHTAPDERDATSAAGWKLLKRSLQP